MSQELEKLNAQMAQADELESLLEQAGEVAQDLLNRAPLLTDEGLHYDELGNVKQIFKEIIKPFNRAVLYAGMGEPIETKFGIVVFPELIDPKTGERLLSPAHTTLVKELARYGASESQPVMVVLTCFGTNGKTEGKKGNPPILWKVQSPDELQMRLATRAVNGPRPVRAPIDVETKKPKPAK
jgi:hypothetical protein